MTLVLKYAFDDFEADLKAAELRRGGIRLKLQLQPFQVLIALLEKPGEVVTREELRQRLWPEDTFVDFDHGLNTAMAKLRDVLGDSASKPRYVETIAKRGYRFNGQVRAIPVTVQTSGDAESSSPATPSAGNIMTSSPATPSAGNIITSPAAIATPVTGSDTALPRASRKTARLLFTLAQILYLIFYVSALFRLDRLYQSSVVAWHGAGHAIFYAYAITAVAGVAVRLYPGLFVLDMFWALAPFLLADRIGMGLALGATAALVYLPFAQRVLVKMMQLR
jgi:cholera toxin transcriptional activator